MTQIAADALDLAPDKIRFELGQSGFPQSGSQGACLALKNKLGELAGPEFSAAEAEDITIDAQVRLRNDVNPKLPLYIGMRTNAGPRVSYSDTLRQNGGQEVSVNVEFKASGNN